METKDFIIYSISSYRSISIFLCACPKPNSYRMARRGPSDTCIQWIILQERNLNFIMGRNYACHFLWWEALYVPYKTVSKPALCSEGGQYLCLLRLYTVQISVKMALETKALTASTCKTGKNTRDPWKIISQ